MTNKNNAALLAGEITDFGTAVSTLRTAMLQEASLYGPVDGAIFAKEAEKCAKAKEVYDKLFAKFQKQLETALIGAGCDELFVDAVEKNDFKLLGY